MDTLNAMMRLLLSVLIGGVIGWERGAARRPAGFRTHILVSLGAAMSMVTGEMVCLRMGTGDSTRIAAQVISGVGFLGAGTILKVGVNIKGLTTAASLWATACLGLTAGAGLFSMALIGLVIVLLTLTILERMEKHFIRSGPDMTVVTLLTDAPSQLIDSIHAILQPLDAELHKLHVTTLNDDQYEVKFELQTSASGCDGHLPHLSSQLCSLPNVQSFEMDDTCPRHPERIHGHKPNAEKASMKAAMNALEKAGLTSDEIMALAAKSNLKSKAEQHVDTL